MSFHSWLYNLRSVLSGQRHHRRQGSLRAARHRPNLEVLEVRLTLSLNAAGSYPVGPYAGVRAGDFDNDGHIDLATGSNLLLGNGDGTFQDAVPSDIEVAYGQVTAADFNGDGVLDSLWCYNPGEFGAVAAVSLGRGDGTFNAPSFFHVGLDTVIGSAVADFNGDGREDLAVGGTYDSDGSAAVTVLLNDGTWSPPPPPLPAFRIGDATVKEGNTGAVATTFTVSLSAASTQTITVAYATANGTASAGSDYQAASGTLAFAPGQTSKTVTVLVKGDRLGEPNETFFVNLSGATNASIADGQGVGTILDDEPRISISDATKSEGKKGGTTLFTFTVTLSAAYDQAVTLSYGTVNGTATTSDKDYVAQTGTLTFAPGQTTKTVTIVVNGDGKKEANEYFYLDLFGNSSNSLFTRSRGTGTILNDD